MTHWRLFYHLVWSTKDREPLITQTRQTIIDRSINVYSEEAGAKIHAIGMMADHVHVVISIPPSVAISDLVRRFKGGSTHAIGEHEGARTFRWQPQFGIYSFDEARLESVVDYVRNQQRHHAEDKLRPNLEITSMPR